MAQINNVATNIISGFLGVGKTSAILSLFKQKPENQKWAVLVNEFGETGIDGNIYQSHGIAVKEIPGGCMCCAQGLPLQVAVNRLLKATRPDRLIIESSGAGHASGVLKTLNGKDFINILTLKASICLLDPENLLDENYLDNELFQQQLMLADVLIANKTDLASAEALQKFHHMSQRFKIAKSYITETVHGKLELKWLDLACTPRRDEKAFIKITAPGKTEWQTHSLSFPASTCFDQQRLIHWIKSLDVIRLKGILKTEQGDFLFNYVSGSLEHQRIKTNATNKLQLIHYRIDVDNINSGLRKCTVES